MRWWLAIVLVVACDRELAPRDPATPAIVDAGADTSDAWSCHPPICDNLCLQQACCDSQAQTTVSGTVYDPAGLAPLFDAVVYVPNAPLTPLAHGAACDACANLSAWPLTAALTDVKGRFTLLNVPVGANIPLVVQIGKWRRVMTIPTVNACVDNPLVDGSVRLPRRPGETSPDDDIPRIAITTGGDDALECVLRRIGISDVEFTSGSGGGRVHLYAGTGGASLQDGASATDFWANNGAPKTAPLASYDLAVLGCEGAAYPNEKPPPAIAAMEAFANSGGTILATHHQSVWLESSLAWSATAPWDHAADPANQLALPLQIDQNFPMGLELAAWLSNVNATATQGTLLASRVHHDIDPMTLTATHMSIAHTSDLTAAYELDTPLYASPCGRVIFADIDVAHDKAGGAFPFECDPSTSMTAQERAFEFMLFEPRVCIQDDAP